jgi:predicted Zn-dependent protease
MRAFLYTSLFCSLIACTTVPISGRKQVKLLPESQMLSMSLSNYDQVKKEVNLLPDSDPRVIQVKKVGAKISEAVNTYLTNNGYKSRLEEFQWEFNVAEDNTVNAWCMPGGKVMFYTGILPITENEIGIAVVMGHEIAHAVARHGNERMSQGLIVQAGGLALDVATSQKEELTRSIFLASYGVASQLGTLKYSRMHESEADQMGLIFMAMAGYDPINAVYFWERMAAQSGQNPTELLSTHPSDETRISDIKHHLPKAYEYYKK